MGQSSNLTETDDDMARMARHQAYLVQVWCSDPLRAQVLSELLLTTYRYASVRAGDQLVALDQELYPVSPPTA
jgi:hypothetical protein